MSGAISYSLESVKKVEESAEQFREIVNPLDEAFAILVEHAEALGMPHVINSAKSLQESYHTSFRVANQQIIATCEEDARLWKAVLSSLGVE